MRSTYGTHTGDDLDETLIQQARQQPDAKHFGPIEITIKRPFAGADPTAFSAPAWRGIASRAPIVRNCISTLILQLMAIPHQVICKDERKREYYQSVIDHSNEEDWNTFLARVAQDTLTVPFGGAIEPLRYGDGTLYNLYHVDGGSLAPTYDPEHPYVQVDPTRSYNRVYFAPGELVRVPWLMRSDLANYGWSYTPVMDAFAAVQALIRSDIFYDTLLSDTPPPGILDLLDMTREEAQDWAVSFRQTFEGIDRFKIPVLYDHQKEAKWIPFQETSMLKDLPEIIRRYAEIVVASFGMSIADLGLYESSQTKAGSVAQLGASKRQGLGALMGKVQTAINALIFPDDVEFKWQPVDTEDAVRKASAQKLRVEALGIAIDKRIISEEQAQRMLVAEGVFIIDMAVEGMPAKKKESEAAQGEEEETGRTPEAQGEEEEVEQSLAHLILDDSYRVRYDWEACELGFIEKAEGTDWEPRAFRSKDKDYRKMRRLLEKEFARIVDKLSLSFAKKAVDLVWDLFPEPKEKVAAMSMADDVVLMRVSNLLGENGNLSAKAIAEILGLLNRAFETGLLRAADDAWEALSSQGLTSTPTHGLVFGLKDPELIRLLENNVMKMGKDIDAGTRSIIGRLIANGVKNGKATYGSKDSIAATIHDAFPEVIGKRRAQSIALFEVNTMQSRAHLKQYETMGLTKKHWVAVPLLACAICMANDALGFVPNAHLYETVFGPKSGPAAHPTVCHCRLEFDRKELLAMAKGENAVTFFDGTGPFSVSLGGRA